MKDHLISHPQYKDKRTLMVINLYLIALISGISACSMFSKYDFPIVSRPARSVPLPEGYYSNVAWLEDDQLAMFHKRVPGASRFVQKLIVYDLDTLEWYFISNNDTLICLDDAAYRSIERLPNGNLATQQECIANPSQPQYKLYEWEKVDQAPLVLATYPEDFTVTSFDVAPNKTSHIVETGSRWTNAQLYLVEKEKLTPLVSNFWRAAAPSWSPDGETIAFVGTENRSQKRVSIFTGLTELDSDLYAPWNVYLMDADGQNVRSILEGIIGASQVKWSPQGKLLAFTGKYEDTAGIWLFNVETSELSRIWDKRTAFDWSPDGKQMVIMEPDENDKYRNGHPLIIDIPFDEIEWISP